MSLCRNGSYSLCNYLTLPVWDLFLVPCRVLYGDRSYSFGLHSVQFLPEVCMIISPVCFLNEMTEHLSLKYAEFILEML